MRAEAAEALLLGHGSSGAECMAEQVHRSALCGTFHFRIWLGQETAQLASGSHHCVVSCKSRSHHVSTMEVSMEAHVTVRLEVQGEAGVRVGPGLVKR